MIVSAMIGAKNPQPGLVRLIWRVINNGIRRVETLLAGAASLGAGMLLAALALVAGAHAATAQSVADFYKGKTVTILVGSDVGGGYDLTARTVAHYLARHVPGRPNVIVQNKPGASSIVAANYVYEIAPKDGTVIAAVQRPIPFQTLFGDTGVRFDVRKMQWLGSTTNSSAWWWPGTRRRSRPPTICSGPRW